MSQQKEFWMKLGLGVALGQSLLLSEYDMNDAITVQIFVCMPRFNSTTPTL